MNASSLSDLWQRPIFARKGFLAHFNKLLVQTAPGRNQLKIAS